MKGPSNRIFWQGGGALSSCFVLWRGKTGRIYLTWVATKLSLCYVLWGGRERMVGRAAVAAVAAAPPPYYIARGRGPFSSSSVSLSFCIRFNKLIPQQASHPSLRHCGNPNRPFLIKESPFRQQISSSFLRPSSSSPSPASASPTSSSPTASQSGVMSLPYEDELRLATRAARLAARLCQAVQRKLVSNETQAKADKSPVTVADYGSQALVSWTLERALPPGSFSLVAEEDANELRTEDDLGMLERITELVNETIAAEGLNEGTPLTKEDVLEAIDRGKSEGGSSGRHWVLDPIDGTRGFLRGDQYAIALALLEGGEVVVGVLACPNLPVAPISNESSPTGPVGCLFSARKGAGTTVQSLNGVKEPLAVHVSSLDDPTQATFCESFESAHSMQDLTAKIAQILGVKASPIRIDSQAKYGAMARGDAAIYLRFPHQGYREKIWDHAAGYIVIKEAGGVVLDAAGKPLDFSKGRFLDLDHGIIATNANIMPLLLSAVQAAL